MDTRAHNFQNQPAPTPIKHKILKSQVGIVSHRHNHRASITDLLSGNHSCADDDSKQDSHRVSPNQHNVPSKQSLPSQIGGFQSVKAENEQLGSDDDSNDCNVADDEEEAFENIKAQNADQTKHFTDNHQQVIYKIAQVEQSTLEVSEQIAKIMAEFNQSANEANNARKALGDKLKQVMDQAETTKNIHEQAREAWEYEIRQQTQISAQRAELIVKLQGELHEANMIKNEALYNLRRNENEINMLNQALEAYGYIRPKNDNRGSKHQKRPKQNSGAGASIAFGTSRSEWSSLDSLKVVLNENERLKDEMRSMIEAAMKDRQAIEYSQRFERLPHMMSQEYKAVIEEYGRNASKNQMDQSQTYINLKRDFEVQRKRTIQLIEEKAGLENELNQSKLVKKEQSEQLKEKVR